MVMKMNKTKFLKVLSEKTGLNMEDTSLVSNVLDDNFFLSKSNKDKTINAIMNSLNIDLDRATSIYEIVIDIVKTEIKNKLKHPFKKQD